MSYAPHSPQSECRAATGTISAALVVGANTVSGTWSQPFNGSGPFACVAQIFGEPSLSAIIDPAGSLPSATKTGWSVVVKNLLLVNIATNTVTLNVIAVTI